MRRRLVPLRGCCGAAIPEIASIHHRGVRTERSCIPRLWRTRRVSGHRMCTAADRRRLVARCWLSTLRHRTSEQEPRARLRSSWFTVPTVAIPSAVHVTRKEKPRRAGGAKIRRATPSRTHSEGRLRPSRRGHRAVPCGGARARGLLGRPGLRSRRVQGAALLGDGIAGYCLFDASIVAPQANRIRRPSSADGRARSGRARFSSSRATRAPWRDTLRSPSGAHASSTKLPREATAIKCQNGQAAFGGSGRRSSSTAPPFNWQV
jgi:hypothetical protein